jgi:hypothetical protein
MDESGVSARRFEGKTRKVISLIMCPVEPLFQDIRAVRHVSVLERVSLALNSLPPLFLTVSDSCFKDPELERLLESFRTFRTPNRYITTYAMICYFRNILVPYVNNLRERLHDQAFKVYVVMDNCHVYGNRQIMPEFESSGIVRIWLPPTALVTFSLWTFKVLDRSNATTRIFERKRHLQNLKVNRCVLSTRGTTLAMKELCTMPGDLQPWM